MQPPYDRLRELARQIVSQFPVPDFYGDHAESHRLSLKVFSDNPMVVKLRGEVAPGLDDNFGHGMAHATAVALDAGSLMAIEAPQQGLTEADTVAQITLVQSAGLLHDIKRKQKDHASHGARKARQILKRYPITSAEVEDVCLAIMNHEAFQPNQPVHTTAGRLLSDCLYDADKFRWGPDNFSYTLWDMVAIYNPTLTDFMARYPKGMAALTKIKSTFRTIAGQTYGPQFIDLGIAIGHELYEAIKADFAEYL